MVNPKTNFATIAAVSQLLAVVVTVLALYYARDVFIPLALAVLLSFLLSPIVNRLQRWGLPNVMAVVITAAISFLLFGGAVTLLGRELTTLVGDLPKHKDELISKARSVAGLTSDVGGSLDRLADEVTEAMEEEGKKELESSTDLSVWEQWTSRLLPAPTSDSSVLPNDGSSVRKPLYVHEVKDGLPLASWATTAGTVLGPLATAGLVSVFALFILIHREDLRDRIIAVISHGNYVTTTEALDEAAGRISRYLIAQMIINLSYGFVLAIGLAIIGSTMTEGGMFPNAILWGVFATCLRFVPYVGPWAAAIFPLAIAISVFPGYNVFLAVLALIITMELFSNNVLEPWLYGSSTGISAVAVIFAAVFWGWLWGPVGLLLSTPLTVCLVVLGRYVPRFRMLATMLGEGLEIKPSLRFYQRMLANDEHRASELLKGYVDEHGFDSACDEMFVPALKRIRADHDVEQLSDSDANRLLAMSGGLVAKLGAQLEEKPSDESIDVELPLVIGCPAHHVSETLILNLLRIGGAGEFKLNSSEDDALPQDVGRQIAESRPVVVVIVVLPKGGFAQSRYLCKTIRREGYAGPIVVACLGRFKNYDRLLVKFRKAGVTSTTTSYSQLRARVALNLKRHANLTASRLKISDPVSGATN